MSSSYSRVSRPIFTKLDVNAMLLQKTLHPQMSYGFAVFLHAQMSFTPLDQYGFPRTDFHETQKCSTTLCADLLRRISLLWDNKCVKYGQKFIYARKYSVAFTAPVFMKFKSRNILVYLWTSNAPNLIQIVRKL
jgi:hypothetical protein